MTIGRFNVRRILGRGGNGIVYDAFDPRLERRVALKVLETAAAAMSGDSGESLGASQVVEAVATRQLRHPALVAIWETGIHRGQPFLAYEFIDGGSLAERLKAGTMEPALAASWTIAIADALHHCHTMGVIHCDVNPANILIDTRDRPHLTDFGIARFTGDKRERDVDGNELAIHHSDTETPIGTPVYMSPEQARGQSLGPATDQYSLGGVLYTLLMGETPQQGDPVAVIAEVALGPDVACTAGPADLAAICRKAMAPHPDNRYGDLGAMADDLRRWQTGQSTVARPLNWRQRLGRWTRRQPVLAGSIGAAASIVVDRRRSLLGTRGQRLPASHNRTASGASRCGRVCKNTINGRAGEAQEGGGGSGRKRSSTAGRPGD